MMRTPHDVVAEPLADRHAVIVLLVELITAGQRRACPGWVRHAACAGDERFYDRGTASASDVEDQREVCDRCPVAADCLLQALDDERRRPVGRASIRGGLLARERRALMDGGIG
ncbi:WhiB family transcriptional regulator [Oerskovia sp. KBS0722]|uniref:WhiB family transcriptional regulator n=1 Tax=Oerskovia sp. KBS0722 TaxID=1179673 RepID=UPI00110E6711|nr:hypothetical protein FFI11_003595 [Oerskovia sp. KBS0722]